MCRMRLLTAGRNEKSRRSMRFICRKKPRFGHCLIALDEG